MPTASNKQTITIAGISIVSNITKTADGQIAQEVTLPAGTAGTLDTRTDDDTGVVGATGHPLSTSDVVDVFWSGGYRYGMTATVSGDNVTIDGGSGDNLPIATTAVVITKRVAINCDFDGDDVEAIAMVCDQRASVDFEDSGDASLEAVELTADQAWDWYADTGVTNPLTGNAVDEIQASNGTTTAATLKIGVLYDSTS